MDQLFVKDAIPLLDRPGLTPVPQAKVQAVVELTLTGEPPGAVTHWTGRAPPRHSGLDRTAGPLEPWPRAQRERCQAFAAQSGSAVVEGFTEIETWKGYALDRRT